jgi:hypothetical protein
MRPSQKVRAWEYFEAGGRRRFALLYNPAGVFLFTTNALALAALNKNPKGRLLPQVGNDLFSIDLLVSNLRISSS